MRDKLAGPKIGKWGQLQEWMEDKDDPKDMAYTRVAADGRLTPLGIPLAGAGANDRDCIVAFCSQGTMLQRT